MTEPYQIDAYAIVSAEGMIADADGVMPASLRHEADHRFFATALESADLIAHGRRSHEGHENSHLRRRFIMTRAVSTLRREDGCDEVWLWNPQGISLDAAARAVGLERGVVAILGGTTAYDMFLARYRAFYLSRAGRTRLPGGVPVFSEMRDGSTAEAVLVRHGLKPEPPLTLTPPTR